MNLLPNSIACRLALSAVTFGCVLLLQACGGGASSTTQPSSGAGVDKYPTSGGGNLGTPIPTAETNAQAEGVSSGAPSIIPGWSEPVGVSLVDVTSLARWSFNSQKTTNWNPGGIEIVSYNDSTNAVALNYDFGCATTVVTTKDADCRNVVEMAASLPSPVSASNAGVISLLVRNLDAGAEFALRVRDSKGQTLQYPFQVRTIERQSTSEWTRVRVSLRYPSVYWGGDNNGSISGSINRVSIVAAPRHSDSATTGLNYPRGRFELKSAQFFPSSGVSYKLQSNALASASGLIPSLAGRMVIAHGNFDLALLQKAKDAGFSAVRRDLFWDVAERNGQYSFSEFESGLNNLSTLGMKVLWILDYGHPDHGGVIPQTQSDIAAFGRFAQAAADFGKQSRSAMGFEVWNEPNLQNWWPNPDPILYGSLYQAALSGVRSTDATIPVISGGVTIDEPSYLFKLAKSGLLANASGVGVHPYRKDTIVAASPSYKRTYVSPEMYANERLITKLYLASQGVNAPLWNTESGYSSAFFLDASIYPDALSESARMRQGNLVLRNVLTQISLNEPIITVYRLIDKGVSSTDKEQNFGLLDAAGSPKPAYIALKNLNDLIKGKLFNGHLVDVPPGVHALRWSSPSGAKTICVWVDNPGEDSVLVLPQGVKSVKSWLGVGLGAKSGDSITLTEAGGPVFVEM